MIDKFMGKQDEFFMGEAIKEARKGLKEVKMKLSSRIVTTYKEHHNRKV